MLSCSSNLFATYCYIFLTLTGCGTPETVANAQITGPSSLTVGSTATYTCNPGYRLVGNEQIVCQNNGQWTTRPTCQLIGATGKIIHIFHLRFHIHFLPIGDFKLIWQLPDCKIVFLWIYVQMCSITMKHNH